MLNRVLFAEAEEFHLSFRLRCDQRELVFSEDLVFHLLELPKYRPGDDNVKQLLPLEKWLYFLKHAEHLEVDELAEQLVDDEFREAAGVLEMISKSPEDRQFYEARMKFLQDEQARLIAAREEGREEGAAQGTLVGKIQMLQEIVGETVVSTPELLKRNAEELCKLLAELQEQLRTRGN